jgi:hypothetical protein
MPEIITVEGHLTTEGTPPYALPATKPPAQIRASMSPASRPASGNCERG